jgi:adenylate kinase
VHPESGRIYHVDNKPPKNPGKDDITGEPLIQRDDDKEATVRKRLEVYHAHTKPLVDFYKDYSNRAPSLRFITMSGIGDIAVIKNELRALLDRK